MAIDPDGDLAVDVLIIGGGIMGHYLVRQLANEYSVCMITDPNVRVETLEAEGCFSAGYDGNDVNRVQPARRAAGYWKLWAESNGVQHDYSQAVFALSDDDVTSTTRLWGDASLLFRKLDELPPIFSGGSIADYVAFAVDNDVIVNPGDVLAKLREGLENCFIEGEVVKFGMSSDSVIEYVEVEIDAELVPVVPRYCVLAASAGNAELLNRMAVRLHDPVRRREAAELARACQAVRKRYVLCMRGEGLPLVAGRFGRFQVVAHPASGSDARIWVVNPPIDDSLTTLGPEDLRFEPPLDSSVVAGAVESLVAMSPELGRLAPSLEWGVYVRRKTEHPMMAVPDTTNVGQPAPAKIENVDLERFMALWPSHLSYSMIVGDVAAERIREALGPRGEPADTMSVDDLPRSRADLRPRWDRDDFGWTDWETFAGAHGIALALR